MRSAGRRAERDAAASDNLARILVDQDEPAVLAVLEQAAQKGVQRAAVRPRPNERAQKDSSPGLA